MLEKSTHTSPPVYQMTLFGSPFLLLFLLILLLCSHSLPICISNDTDPLALLDFKSRIVNDPFGVMASWNNSIHFCHWNGVNCGHRHQRVTFLNLSSHRLEGSISPHIGNLSFLKYLNLENNRFTGQIPSELGRLHRLTNMHLENNSLTGEIPANLSSCVKLTVVDLARNHLQGRLPVELGFFINLQVLSLYINNFTGNIPSSFGNLSSLQKLSVGSNRLSGRIPYTIGQLKNLKKFFVGDNRFEGTIPMSIFNLSSVEAFDVSQNKLHGSLPPELVIFLPNLQYFGIFENRFSGIIPPSLSNASNIQEIDLDGNELSGQMPNLGTLHKLETLNVYNNSLGSGREGDLRFLSTLTNATRLRSLAISINNFGGVLPQSLANLSSTTLILLDISGNQIGGRLPVGIANLKSLEVLTAWSNLLSDSIPEDIGKLQSLHYLELSENEFTGNIPPSIGNLGNLISLVLDDNMLQGSIPSSLGNCQSLLQFGIANNNISGAIPPTLFTISTLSMALDLSGNKLTGSLPMEIGNLKNLGKFDVYQNMLSGVLPSSLGSCVMLETLYMDNNMFHGAIPPSFASLRGLKQLDLSHNNLSGHIPNFLESFEFQVLNLSFNNFSGLVPSGGIFRNASAISVEGNNMLCGTTPHLRLPICIFQEGKKRRLTVKVKIIVGIVLLSLAALVISVSIISWLSKKKSKEDVTSSSEKLLLQVSYQTLSRATQGFSSTKLIGIGGFGSVYKGILLDTQRIVAVKVFHLQRRGASRSFMAECEALRNIRHRNLVKVITACSSIDSSGDDFKAIVYEFMVNGNLDQWLHPVIELHESTRKLNLLQRLSIAIDIASALDYLHHQYGQSPIVHCDLKPTNILLNDEMTAQVGDFGLMKFLSESANDFPTSTTGLRGTIGYAPPEYGTGSEVSTYGDVYSYGILLLEMFTARRPTDEMFNNNMNLHNYVKMALPDQVTAIADPIFVQEARDSGGGSERYKKVMESLVMIFGIGTACSEESPRKRMNISDALAELILIKDKLNTQEEAITAQQLTNLSRTSGSKANNHDKTHNIQH